MVDLEEIRAEQVAKQVKGIRDSEFEKEVAICGVYNRIDTRMIAFKWSDTMDKWPGWVEDFYTQGGILSDAIGHFYAKINNFSFERLKEGEWLMLDRYGIVNSMPPKEFKETYEKIYSTYDENLD